MSRTLTAAVCCSRRAMKDGFQILLILVLLAAMTSCGSPAANVSNTSHEANSNASSMESTPGAVSTTASETPAAVVMDPCLVGTWKTVSIVDIKQHYYTRGGGGATVTFQADGLEKIDYAGMEPMLSGGEYPTQYIWEGKTGAIISAAQGKASVIEGRDYDLTSQVLHRNGVTTGKHIIKGRGDRYADFLGPAGLGSVKPENRYSCDGDLLTYESSGGESHTRMDDGSSTAWFRVKLQRTVNPDLKSR